jgi:predicted MPP superfamily phosphohydrolase
MKPTLPAKGPFGALGRRRALRLLAGGTVAAFANALWIEPRLLWVSRHDIARRNLPSGLEGLRVGVLADFHFRPDQDEALLEKVVDRVNAEELDLLALAGDYVTRSGEVLAPLLRILERVRTRHGVFAVMGNHDGWHPGRSFTRRAFEKAGIPFLINQSSLLRIKGDALAVAGSDFVWLGKPDPAATLKGIAAATPVLALVHEPDYFDVMSARRDILLQVSGHTHGGQCRVPLVGYAPVKVDHGRKYIKGLYERGGSNLFVTSGVGTVGPRVRFACPPELAVLTLRDAGKAGRE